MLEPQQRSFWESILGVYFSGCRPGRLPRGGPKNPRWQNKNLKMDSQNERFWNSKIIYFSGPPGEKNDAPMGRNPLSRLRAVLENKLKRPAENGRFWRSSWAPDFRISAGGRHRQPGAATTERTGPGRAATAGRAGPIKIM